ncbi:polysaccharide deacetylase family protein [Paenalkalicoccus suaedae]|uniref:Polysaccharide deacetylase family protein n=1 Tax=Paenalkalicoccus suaedae TaxID=2592382 RepID=A0A859FEX7_9BACI|nr:polysaccharide deacetylase family protein [Paenalkalicoccus suaedae]QKS71388.1 polysaccharide deacetylase family protein [Paenalkalicoccus suaedae]
MKKIALIGGSFLTLMISFIIVVQVAGHPEVLTAIASEDDIKQAASERNESPIDAYIDPVWKAIPGYNGREVDIEASLKRMDKQFDETKLAYNEVSPSVHLQDLEPTPIYKGNNKKAATALMINVAWGNEYLLPMLETLEQHKVKATFFLDGSWTNKNKALATMIVEAGHEVGNHGYSHPDMKSLTASKIREEIDKTQTVIQVTTGVKPTLFAPPSGSYRQEVVDIAREYGLYTVLWTVDTVDWRNPDPTSMASRVIKEAAPGTLMLMHPTKASSEALDTIIEGLQTKGLSLLSVSELLSEKRVD